MGAVTSTGFFLAALVALELPISIYLTGAGLTSLLLTFIAYRMRIRPLFKAWQAEER